MPRILKRLKNWLLDIVFPRYCLGCRAEGFYVCHDCFKKIPVNISVACFVCGRRSPDGRVCAPCRQKIHPPLAGLLVASDWQNELLKKIIYAYKYNFIRELSSPLSQIMINFLMTNNFNNLSPKEIILVPVPLHKKRFVWRGFNQAEDLAQKISDYFSLPQNNELLWRFHHTLPQAEMTKQLEREKNIQSAFSLAKNFPIDDQDFLKIKLLF